MADDTTLEGLAHIVWEITGITKAQIVPGAHLVDDLDIDSISTVEVIAAAEDKFGVRIPDEDLGDLKTIGDVVAYIEKAGARV